MTALSDQSWFVSQEGYVVGGGTLSAPAGQTWNDAQSDVAGRCGPSSPPPAIEDPRSRRDSRVGEEDLASAAPRSNDIHASSGGAGEPPSPPPVSEASSPMVAARVGEYAAYQAPITSIAETVTDLERLRIATTHRIGAINRERGRASDSREADIETEQLWAVADALLGIETQTVKELERAMRKHPLGTWVKATPGLGLKQTARLLAAIGNPYWRPEITRGAVVEPPRPRRGPAELWAYTGFHVLPAGQVSSDAQSEGAGGQPLHPTDQHSSDNQPGSVGGVAPLPVSQTQVDVQQVHAGGQSLHPTDQRSPDVPPRFVGGVAPRRRKGQHANWNDAARMRARLVAESCIKARTSPYRLTYDEGRAKYADAVHNQPCPQCGPAGKPAQPGSPLSAGHQHARALRLVAKAILRDMYLEAKRWHLETPQQPEQDQP